MAPSAVDAREGGRPGCGRAEEVIPPATDARDVVPPAVDVRGGVVPLAADRGRAGRWPRQPQTRKDVVLPTVDVQGTWSVGRRRAGRWPRRPQTYGDVILAVVDVWGPCQLRTRGDVVPPANKTWSLWSCTRGEMAQSPRTCGEMTQLAADAREGGPVSRGRANGEMALPAADARGWSRWSWTWVPLAVGDVFPIM